MIATEARVGARVVFTDKAKVEWKCPVYDGVGTIVEVGFKGHAGTCLVRWSLPAYFRKDSAKVEWWVRYDQVELAGGRDA